METTTIGLDIAKRVFQAHGVDGAGKAVLRRKLRRAAVLAFFKKLPPCLVGIEACSTAHHWAREIRALGHEVRLMPASYVKPYVKRGKTDAADAEAICEAVTSAPTEGRSRWADDALRAGQDRRAASRADAAPDARPAGAAADHAGERLARAYGGTRHHRAPGDRARGGPGGRAGGGERGECAGPGVGPITASAIVATAQTSGFATATDPAQFHSARHFAAWIGLVPKQNSSGAKQRQGGISKQGDRTLRRLLVLGATAVIRHARTKPRAEAGWLKGLPDRRPAKLAAVAQANRTARTVWALLVRGGTYRGPTAGQAAAAQGLTRSPPAVAAADGAARAMVA